MAETEDRLPAILVHRQTMRVIDGMHRLSAARYRGEQMIDAIFFDGDTSEAFVLAVRANITHGLPLSLIDRHAAARQILSSHPDWSDRYVASCTGLAGKTVRSLRGRSTENDPQLNARLGRDGRRRPLDPASLRRRAAALIVERPKASLREIAREVGMSPTTVSDVRERLRQGGDPVGKTASVTPPAPRRESSVPLPDSAMVNLLASLRRDPTVRMTRTGRALIVWLHKHAVQCEDHQRLLEAVPDHCLEPMALFAGRLAERWALIASDLHERLEQHAPINEEE
ncbi:MAG: helix-turn-helix domain-containing protein [Brachybacterium sp.]|nr:helix-turn-helix domain-containing protein [Brachybacterium sp.]